MFGDVIKKFKEEVDKEKINEEDDKKKWEM